MADALFNKYRAAIEVLQRGRDGLVDELAEDILSQGDEFMESGFLFNEFLETQGTRLHFLSLLLGQLEHSADLLDETLTAPPPPPLKAKEPAKRKPRAKKVQRPPSKERSAEDA